ncbi:MAG TPA: transposase [Candidatus Paceibacterota bacterium]
MPRNVTFAEGEFYHLYNRGTEKRIIFTCKADYERFMTLLFLCNGKIAVDLKIQGRTLYEVQYIDKGETIVDICAYCLMPNHFHLLLKEKTKNGISHFLQKLLTGYTMYFNKRYDRRGTLFEGRSKARHADGDQYLSYLFAYIHLNPVKLIDPRWKESGIANKKSAELFLKNYQWSSFTDYCGTERLEKLIINKTALPEYAETAGAFKRMVTDWLDYKKENLSTVLQGRTL